MKQKTLSHEFHARLGPDGTITVPDGALGSLRPGELVRVSVSAAGGTGRSARRVPDEAEVTRIAMKQMESPDVVRDCLLAQGILARSGRFSGPRGGNRKR